MHGAPSLSNTRNIIWRDLKLPAFITQLQCWSYSNCCFQCWTDSQMFQAFATVSFSWYFVIFNYFLNSVSAPLFIIRFCMFIAFVCLGSLSIHGKPLPVMGIVTPRTEQSMATFRQSKCCWSLLKRFKTVAFVFEQSNFYLTIFITDAIFCNIGKFYIHWISKSNMFEFYWSDYYINSLHSFLYYFLVQVYNK